jgi:hypothetical protein
VAQSWAASQRWTVAGVSTHDRVVTVTALGPPPDADISELRREFNSNGLADVDLTVTLVVGGSGSCPKGGETCLPTY